MNVSGLQAPKGLGTFKWLNGAQFFGALNDNLFKFFCIFALIEIIGEAKDVAVNSMAGAVFALPFLLFSEAAGVWADRYDKRRIIVKAKFAELLIMCFGCLALWVNQPALIFAVLFFMAGQSAFFSPTKYGIIPELVEEEQLSKANGYIQMYTYCAIILGTILASVFGQLSGKRYNLVAPVCILFAVIGWWSSLKIQACRPAGSTRRINPLFIVSIFRTVSRLRARRYLFAAVLSAAFFLFIGAYIQLNIIPYGREVLGLDKESSNYLFLLAALGIGLGAVTAGRMSGRNIEFGIVPMGSIGMTLATLGLGLAPTNIVWSCALMFLLGLSAGVFIVPLNAFIQATCSDQERGEVLAAESFLSWIGVLAAAGLLVFNQKVLGFNSAQGYLVLSANLLALTVATLVLLPDFLVRVIAILIARLFYRIRVVHPERVPHQGPALLVCNHASWIDAYVLLATQQRRVRFVMDKGMYFRWRWLTPLFRLLRVIPISAKGSPREILTSLNTAREALEEGYLVCIFAEGQVTRSGFMLEFKGGLERILKGTDVPVIPVYIGGAWGSIFSYAEGHTPGTRMPTRIPYPVTLLFGEALPATTPSWRIRQAVAELSVDYFDLVKPQRRPIGEMFIRSARRSASRLCMADATGKEFTFRKVLAASLTLRRHLESKLGDNAMVGVWLPTGIGAALTNLALTLARRIPVNLNFTAGPSSVSSACKQCELQFVISSRAFEESVGPVAGEGIQTLYLEDLMAGLTTGQRLRGLLASFLAPARWLEGSSRDLKVPGAAVSPYGERFSADDVFTVIFSSGSTSTPKGILLSHHNILSNIESFRTIIEPTEKDNITTALPFFHSFGFTVGLWFPMLSGFSAAYHTKPLEAATIGELAEKYRASIMVATPSFLLGYLRKVKPEAFAHVRCLVVGAEKCKPALATKFHERFGVMPLEGYGATECSPVIACSAPDVAPDGVKQIGTKPGSVGRALPGIATRIVDPESRAELPPGETGELWVKGPNVMLGYLKDPERTSDVLVDGWYRTGDLCQQDADGFIRIVDRLSRFSKIAGEMVPHHGVEHALHQLLETEEQVMVVTSIPDEKRGERLAVLYIDEVVDLSRLLDRLKDSDALPNLWKPSANAFVAVKAFPALGSGKLDLKGVKALAVEALQPASPTPSSGSTE